jgi:hypothetical protein
VLLPVYKSPSVVGELLQTDKRISLFEKESAAKHRTA